MSKQRAAIGNAERYDIMENPVNQGRCGLLLDEVSASVLIVGRDGIIRYVNRTVCSVLGKAEPEIVGVDARKVFWPEFISVYDRIVAECEKKQEYTCVYYWSEMALWEQIVARTIIWSDQPSVLLTISTVSDVILSEYQLTNRAYFDTLLNLPNGNKLEDDINVLANLETVALIYFKVKRFNDINELYGWECGDELLRQIRDWVLVSESRRAQLYRVNNGFAILGRKVSMDDAYDRVAEIQRRFKKPWTFTLGGNNIFQHFSINIGIVYGKYVKNEMRNLLSRTIHAAESTEDGFAVYDEDVDRNAKKRLQLQSCFINCVSSEMRGFSVNYQPIVNVENRNWIGVEALCRWTTPTGEKVPPVDFILTAERLHLVAQVDAWVRKTAMRQCVAAGLATKIFTLDVNFSPVQQIDGTFIQHLLDCLQETRFPSEKLNIEITESAKMNFDKNSIDTLGRLKDHGIKLSLDDFGTGHSSMENLLKLSADAIKTEKLFLDGLENDAQRQHLLRTLVEFARYLHMSLIAEGVETEEQLALIREYGVQYAQGYLFSKPLTYEQLRDNVGRFQNPEPATITP